MRHRVYGRHLGRNNDERIALFKSLVRSLFAAESIETTESKIKSIKGLVDKLINQAKSPKTANLVSQFLNDKETSQKLIKDIAPRFKTRNSGYTSLVRVGKRLGDGAVIMRMSLIEGPTKEVISSQKKIVVEKIKDKVEKKVSKKAQTKPSTRKAK